MALLILDVTPEISCVSIRALLSLSLTKTEYIDACDSVDEEVFYRDYPEYEDEYITVNLVVEEKITDTNIDSFGSEYNVYYLCSPVDGGDFKILVRDCVQSNKRNYLAGDVIAVYGEGAGEVTIYGIGGIQVSAPCIYAAHIDIER